MTITQKQSAEMLEAAKPLIRWMNENTHPHCVAIVDTVSVELTEGVAIQKTIEFVKG